MAIYGQTVVDVFDNHAVADNAVNALQNAGVNPGQIHVSEHQGHPTTNYWQAITRLFSSSKGRDAVVEELKNLGIPDDKVSYYENEYDVGHSIIAVNAPGNEENVSAILRENGGHD